MQCLQAPWVVSAADAYWDSQMCPMHLESRKRYPASSYEARKPSVQCVRRSDEVFESQMKFFFEVMLCEP